MTRFEPPPRTGDPFRRRERVFAREHNAPQRSSQVLLAIGLALAAFLFTGVCSFSQASDESHALSIIRSSVAATTDIDLLVAVELDDIRAAAEADGAADVRLTGFPFDVSLTPDEARDLAAEDIRELLLDRAAAEVYAHGLAAFDTSGQQDVDSLTSQGMLNRSLGTLTAGNHDTAMLASWILLAITAVLGAVAVASRDGQRRFLVLGGGLALAGCIGLIASGMAFLTVRVLAGGADPFVTELRSLVESLVEVPLRNFTVLAFLGLAIWAIAPLLALLERQQPPGAGDEYDGWEGDDVDYEWYDEDQRDLTGGWDRGRA